jgi:CheY-like chemotaxis protein
VEPNVDVLVVDDDADLRMLLVLVLEEHDLVVRTASNGRQAFELAVELHPRLVLSDLMMPVMRGDALYAALQANVTTADIAFVLMTAIPTKAPDAVRTVVGKPIDLGALEVLLLDVLEKQPY